MYSQPASKDPSRRSTRDNAHEYDKSGILTVLPAAACSFHPAPHPAPFTLCHLSLSTSTAAVNHYAPSNEDIGEGQELEYPSIVLTETIRLSSKAHSGDGTDNCEGTQTGQQQETGGFRRHSVCQNSKREASYTLPARIHKDKWELINLCGGSKAPAVTSLVLLCPKLLWLLFISPKHKFPTSHLTRRRHECVVQSVTPFQECGPDSLEWDLTLVNLFLPGERREEEEEFLTWHDREASREGNYYDSNLGNYLNKKNSYPSPQNNNSIEIK